MFISTSKDSGIFLLLPSKQPGSGLALGTSVTELVHSKGSPSAGIQNGALAQSTMESSDQ